MPGSENKPRRQEKASGSSPDISLMNMQTAKVRKSGEKHQNSNLWDEKDDCPYCGKKCISRARLLNKRRVVEYRCPECDAVIMVEKKYRIINAALVALVIAATIYALCSSDGITAGVIVLGAAALAGVINRFVAANCGKLVYDIDAKHPGKPESEQGE